MANPLTGRHHGRPQHEHAAHPTPRPTVFLDFDPILTDWPPHRDEQRRHADGGDPATAPPKQHHLGEDDDNGCEHVERARRRERAEQLLLLARLGG